MKYTSEKSARATSSWIFFACPSAAAIRRGSSAERKMKSLEEILAEVAIRPDLREAL